MKTNRFMAYLVLFLALAVAVFMPTIAPTKPALPPLETVKSVNLTAFSSQPWFEIASIDFFFQKDCVKNAMAQYTMLAQQPGQPVTMIDKFTCDKANGKQFVATGRVKVLDVQTNAKLSATFLNLVGWRYWFGDNYWILDLDSDYRYLVVGNPSRQVGWILARTALLPKATLQQIVTRLTAQGYDTCQFMISPQDGGLAQKMPLCKFLR
jgi:apolipoprotein D and lipocalin family protein